MRDGRSVQMGLGPFPDVSLAEARELASIARSKLRNGADPLAAKRAERSAQKIVEARSITFGKCASDYIDQHRAAWKNDKHIAQWEATFIGDDAATSAINKLPVGSIDTALVLQVLRPIWKEKPETASRVRGRMERVLAFATVSEYRTGDNPARWRGHLKEMLPAKSQIHTVQHHPALPYEELPAFMASLRSRDSISARALEFTVLTAARTNEAIGALWNEFDFVDKIWVIPAERMKAKKSHRVPLSEDAIELLKRLPRVAGSDQIVFPGARVGCPLSNMAMLQLVRGINDEREKAGLSRLVDPKQDRREIVPHGFRSTFRDWSAERTNFPNHVVEMALAHTLDDKVEAAYRRGELLQKRQKLMADWARYCATAPSSRDEAVTLPGIRCLCLWVDWRFAVNTSKPIDRMQAQARDGSGSNKARPFPYRQASRRL
jgi:integrase